MLLNQNSRKPAVTATTGRFNNKETNGEEQ
jgi:hypothetical protein